MSGCGISRCTASTSSMASSTTSTPWNNLMKGILLLHRQWRPHGFALRRLETQLQDHQGQSAYRYGRIHQRSTGDQPATGSVGALSGPVDALWPLVGR